MADVKEIDFVKIKEPLLLLRELEAFISFKPSLTDHDVKCIHDSIKWTINNYPPRPGMTGDDYGKTLFQTNRRRP